MKKMVFLKIIKNILNKIKISNSLYIFIILSLIIGFFNNLFYFMIIIFIHELAHTLFAYIFKFNIINITLYPFGGISNYNYLINNNLIKELIVTLMGPIIQVVFTYIIYYNYNFPDYFFYYSKLILIFNLLPIYPLDGGKLLNILLSIFISFYKSLKITYYISYFFLNILFIFIIYYNNLYFYLVYISLVINIIKEYNNINYLFNRFIMERILYKFNFKRKIIVKNIYNFKRNRYHIINNNFSLVKEERYLKTIYNLQKIENLL